MVNVFDPEWEVERRAAGGLLRGSRVGAQAGARQLGASVYELDPGAVVSPFHLHHANEELLVVLAGTPTVRRATTTDVLRPGDVLAFTAGPEWAHRVENRSGEPARVLIVSTMHRPEVAEYPDTGNVLTLTGDPAGAGVELRAFRLADRVDHLEGELGHP